MYIILAVFMAVSVVLQSCGGQMGQAISFSKSKLETEFASTAELVVDNMIETYKQVQDISFQSEFDGAVAGVLSRSIESYEPSQLVNDSIRKKIEILYLYKQAVHEYAILAGDGFTGKQAAFSNCCQAIVDGYARLNDSLSLSTSKALSGYIRSTRYDESAVALVLMETLNDVWAADSKVLVEELNRNFFDYQTTLSLVNDDAFNEEKLQKYVDQPYDGKHNLVEVYKINLIKERRRELNEFVRLQDDISSSLQYINQALKEMIQKNCDSHTVLNYLKRVQVVFDDARAHQHSDDQE